MGAHMSLSRSEAPPRITYMHPVPNLASYLCVHRQVPPTVSQNSYVSDPQKQISQFLFKTNKFFKILDSKQTTFDHQRKILLYLDPF